MAVEQPGITKPDLKEVIASATVWVAVFAVTLSNEVLRADQALALAAVAPTLAWTVLNTHAFRHWFTPKPSAADGDEKDAEGDAPARWGIHRRWLLGIVTPVVLVVLLSIGYDLSELVGPGVRLPAPIAVVLLFAVAPWIVGLVAWLLLVVPGGLIYSGLRPDMDVPRARVFGGIWAYVLVAAVITASQAATGSTFGRPGWMGEMLGTLLGFNEEAMNSPGWLWAARVLFAMGFLVMPVVGLLMLKRFKQAQTPQVET